MEIRHLSNFRGVVVALSLIVFFAWLGNPREARALDFSVDLRNWEFSDEDSLLSQSYSISVAPEVTRTIGLGASFRYVRRDQGKETRETLTPTLSMEIANDLFTFNLSGTQTERKDTERPDITNRSWDANLMSDYKDYAEVRLYVGQSFDKDDARPRRLDDTTLHYGLQVSKDWKGLSLLYNYRGTDEKDRVAHSTTKTGQHFFKAEYSGTWRKLSFTLGQQVNLNKTVVETEASPGEEIRFPLNVGVAWNPPMPSPGSPLVRDQEIVIDLQGQPVDEISFYINGTFFEPVPSTVRWDLYESDDGEIWESLRTSIALPYRFRRTYQRRRYLKLVVVEVPVHAPELENPRVQASLIRLGTGPTEKMTITSDSLRTNLTLAYAFTPNLSANYYFSYNKNSPDPGAGTTNVNHTLSASWAVNRFFEPHLNLSTTTKDTEGEGKDETVTIALNNTSQIYETLQVITGYTHAISKEDGKTTHTSDTLTFTTTANLYPDLDLRWNGNLSRTRSYFPGVTTTGLGTQLYLTARLTPSLTVSGTYDINRSESTASGGGTVTNHLFTIDASWRMSDDFSLKGTESVTISGEGEDTLNSTYSVWFALTPKIQANLQYMNSRGGHSTTHNYSAFVSWKVSPHLTLKSTYDSTIADGDVKWGWMMNLVAYF